MSDSLIVKATGCSVERLMEALQLCTNFEGEPASFRYWDHRDNGLAFPHHDGTPLPVPITPAEAARMAHDYVMGLAHDRWPEKPDIDGHCKRGWSLIHDWNGTTVSPFWMIFHE